MDLIYFEHWFPYLIQVNDIYRSIYTKLSTFVTFAPPIIDLFSFCKATEYQITLV